MKFNVPELKRLTSLEQEEKFPAADLLGSDTGLVHFSMPVLAFARAKVLASGIEIKGNIKTTASFTCGRCLEDFKRDIQNPFEDLQDINSEIIDMSDKIREALLIDLPMNPTCRDNCQGLCQTCGKNKNKEKCTCATGQTHPRWNALGQVQI
jgi:uncharacterized protein